MTRRTRRDPPACTDAHAWLKLNGHHLAGLTGQDARALSTIAHCWKHYAAGDASAEHATVVAVTALTASMQHAYRPLARELIAYAMDWNDRARLWPLVEAMLDSWMVRATPAKLKLVQHDDRDPEMCPRCHTAINEQGLCLDICSRTIEQFPPVTR